MQCASKCIRIIVDADQRQARTELVACPSSSLFCFQSCYSNCSSLYTLLRHARPLSLTLSLFLSASLCTFVFLRVSLPAFPRFLSIHTKPRCKRLIGLRPPRDANDRIPFPRFGPVDAMHLVARSSNENRITRRGVYDRKIVFRLSDSQPDCSERTCPITLLRSNFPLKEFLTVI